MKYVLNRCYGGFGLSAPAIEALIDRKLHGLTRDAIEDLEMNFWRDLTHPLARNDVDLVAVVEEMGADANGLHAALEIVECPLGVEQLELLDYDGIERLAEKHRVWPSRG